MTTDDHLTEVEKILAEGVPTPDGGLRLEPIPFGFTVTQKASGWRVFLPHQCNDWDITGDRYQSASHVEAVAELEEFIVEAQRALEALRNLTEFDASKES